ncbi:MAG TPA: tetratricopeptide repeat protein [Candidatus Elarobacter sp.]|nr:tetratricopeptide repeat protein [Candidatus Elarobacter sp.]
MSLPDRVPAEIARLFEIVRREPRQFGALMQLGTLLAQSGNVAAARTVYAQAVREHPNVAGPHVCLGTLLVDAGEHAEALRLFAAALRLDPANREAQRGIAVVQERDGDLEAAADIWRHAFPKGSLETSPYRGDGAPVRLLYLTSALGGNVPMQHVFDDRCFQVTTLIAESAPGDIVLPPHDAVFNAIGDADRCARALGAAARIVASSPVPVFNDPARVREATRLRNARRLRSLEDVVTANAVEFARDELTEPTGATLPGARGLRFPLLLRSLGYQTGEHFVRIDSSREVSPAAAALPGTSLLALEFIDSRGADQVFRKYRVMTIGGRLYPVHLAMAAEWKVHYFRSEMAGRADYRAEEARFLADMPAAIGTRAVAALDRIAAVLALDYGGIDFALLPDGRVLVFEANATMILVPPDGDARWDYRRIAVSAAIDAARGLLVSHAR